MSFPLKPVVALQDVRELGERPFKMAIMSAAIKKMVSGLVILLLFFPFGSKAGEIPPDAGSARNYSCGGSLLVIYFVPPSSSPKETQRMSSSRN